MSQEEFESFNGKIVQPKDAIGNIGKHLYKITATLFEFEDDRVSSLCLQNIENKKEISVKILPSEVDWFMDLFQMVEKPVDKN